MPRIVPGIETLDQHRSTLSSDPERYRPKACTQCGLAHPWAHGCYPRKSDRPPEGDGRRHPILIPRFRCRNPACRHTCSRLPSCIPPRRWYLWSVQQLVLIRVLTGVSLCAAGTHFALRTGPARSTIRRWRDGLRPAPTSQAPAGCFIFQLKGRFPALAQGGDGDAFWLGCLRRLGLAGAMTALDALGVVVP
jgi:hypothetical protein